MTTPLKIDAGDFDAWLQSILLSFKTGEGVEVPCGECRGCCSAGRFIHLTPADTPAHSAIPKPLRQPAPGMPQGHAVMGYLADGRCPMLKDENCSIYPSRPSTCRTFDCRVLAAAGLEVGGRWNERINGRLQAWRFSFPSESGRQRLQAIRSAAAFIGQHREAFPGGRAPTEPTTIAVLAIKVHPVFLSPSRDAAPREIAEAVVAASRAFESGPP